MAKRRTCAECRGKSGKPLCCYCDICKNCHPGQLHSYNLTVERQDAERKRQREVRRGK